MTVWSRRYDLHSHTIASDGELTPTELVYRAVANHVDVLAITDHDSISGLNEARKTLIENNLPLQLINGVELSTAWNNQDVHIVGLNVDITNVMLLDLLDIQKEYRIERAKEISYKLAQFGIINAYEHAQIYAKGDSVSRAHFARYLTDAKIVKNISSAFKRYLSKGKKAYVAPRWCSIKTAVNVIHSSGGQAVLAHPMRYNLTWIKLKMLLDEFKQSKGDAIEISQSRQTNNEQHQLEKYAIEYDLLGSRGSDFHGSESYLDLGQTTPFSTDITPIWHNWPQHDMIRQVYNESNLLYPPR